MSGRHRAPGRPPLPLWHHFWWTFILVGFAMVGVVAVAYVSQVDWMAPNNGRPTWTFDHWHHSDHVPPDTSRRIGATP